MKEKEQTQNERTSSRRNRVKRETRQSRAYHIQKKNRWLWGKNLSEPLEIKTMTTKLTTDVPNNRIYITENKIIKLKYLTKEISQGTVKNNEIKIGVKLRDRNNNYRRFNIHLIGVLGGKKPRGNNQENNYVST